MKIEKNIPVPESRGGGRKYPFSEMSVGDSIFFEGANSEGVEYNAAKVSGLRWGWKFRARSVDGGLRIWRVE